ncbi:uncharacterized protein LOC107225304 isoform X3 [Neodiprion lecontei]|uniref:Uncharacterized protein LOC107225304 isoform X3 n=1 Tax=Neodiprion lecontei TaxID=441921 RepID=A0ABM3GEV6_NEOLC|nr:uncharacterized protein LOC124184585 isoform X3 [Neodiprion fabricii]XP_046598818.1 uncharacterized protein LOC107225304 isoform X3 [Neodiprion lecontei]
MRCILIFDHLNDVLFTKCNKKFAAHIQKLARIQGLIPEDKDENDVSNKLSPNTIIQLFAPIVTSQRVMACQFGNSYTSVQCQDGTNMVFDDFMGYMFVYIASSDVTLMKRTLGVCVSIVRHLCGPDVALLKWNKQRVSLVSSLLDAWITLRGCEQSILVEAIEQLSVNPDLASATLRALHDATDKLRTQSEFSNVHALILVENKFLSLYSSKNSLDLSASDILLMMLLCWVAGDKGKLMEDQDNFDDDFLSPENSLTEESKGLNIAGKLANPTCKDITNLFGDSRDSSISEGLYKLAEDDLYSQLVLLGSGHNYTANAIHITELADGINLVIIIEASNLSTSSGLYDSFYYLNTINNLQLQKDIDELKPAFDNLDAAIKKSIDGIKKNRNHINNDIDMCQRRLQVKWEFIRKKYVELLKSRDPECVLRIESSTSGFTDTMKELLQLTCFDKNFLKQGVDVITAIWTMVDHSRAHLQEGHLSVMWKDTTFNYAYFLWFEDNSGSPLKCKIHPNHLMKNLPLPGIICGDYYKKLVEVCFPKLSPNKIRIYELYCVHLGLATSSCVLEHSRRLAATIWEVTGVPNNPIDIL